MRMPQDDRAIAISATFTAEAIQPGLAFWVEELGLRYEIKFAGYNQVFQELLDPGGLFARNRDGVNVVLVRQQDWPVEGWAEFLNAVHDSPATAPLILVECPGAGESGSPGKPHGLAHLITAEEVAE